MTLHSIRVSDAIWLDEVSFRSLIRLLGRYPRTIDQVTLFTTFIHTPAPVETMRERAALLRERIRAVKEAGYGCGINLLATVGHHEEDLGGMVQGDYDHMTDVTGKVCRGSFCFADERFLREYIVPVYRLLAEAAPDYIWVDDDVRYGHAPVGPGCFCDHCIELFNAVGGTRYTREELVSAMAGGDLALQRAWLDFNSKKITKLLEVIRRTVEEVSPTIGLGFMSGNRFYEGFAFGEWADALTGHGRLTALWRPGGGAYTDYDWKETLLKAGYIGIQSSLLPDYVKVVQAEIENFPYQMRKGPRYTALEGLLYMTAGCTGAAFNVLPGDSREPVEVAEPVIRAISETNDFARRLAESLRGATPCGVRTGWNRYSATGSHGPLSGGGSVTINDSWELSLLGIPQAFKPVAASCHILTGEAPWAWSDEELIALLSGGVFLDATAVRLLNERGLGRYVGFRTGRSHPVDCRERYLDHPLNGEIAGRIRNGRQSFYPGDSVELLPAEGAEVLSEVVDYHDRLVYPCAMGLYRNELGGIVCASGYYPLTLITDRNKAIQLKRLFRLLSKGTLPGYLESPCRARLTAHRRGDGRMAWTLFNHNLDVAQGLSLLLKTDATRLRLTDMGLRETCLETEEEKNGYRRLSLPDLPPWEFVLIEEP